MMLGHQNLQLSFMLQWDATFFFRDTFFTCQLTGCPCLWGACSVQDELWLHFGETEPSGVLKSAAGPLWWSAGCWGWRPAQAEQRSAGERSTLKTVGLGTEAASGTGEGNYLTTNTLSLKERHR